MAAGAAGLAYDRSRFPVDFFSFQGPVGVVSDRDSPSRYKIRFGRLLANLDEHSASRLFAAQKQVGRIVYHIRPSPLGAHVTVLRAEAPDGSVLDRDLRLDGDISLSGA